MNLLQQLHGLGQSVWLDSIQRRWLENGELKAMIDRGEIRGVTSNPTIFHQAISKSTDYDGAISALAWAGWDAEKILWELAIEDIRRACDLFLPLYEESGGGDGYVSLEEDPLIAHDTEAAVVQAQQLWARVSRPNLMVKIPATREGIPAIRRSIASGVNVNVTLIFALSRYETVMEAYLAGLEDRLSAGLPVDHVASVASFFVSRVDSKIDAWLPQDSSLRGKAAIANAKLAYAAFLETFAGERWRQLTSHGARLQRPLWASTSTKNPDYPDTLYVDSLVGANTINTMPLPTMDAAREHGHLRQILGSDAEDARQFVRSLEAEVVSLDRATAELETDGVKAFADSWRALLKLVDERRAGAVAQLGPLAKAVAERITMLQAAAVPDRIWRHDAALWSSEPSQQVEIRRRLGWLDLPASSRSQVQEMLEFAEEVHREGIGEIRLLGMGGSALAPEVFARAFRGAPYPLTVIDSIEPGQVRNATETEKRGRPLYVVSSKSGSTAEVLALLDHFRDLVGDEGSRFVAITDPGTGLELAARNLGFRRFFLADADVGGRYSALSHFGLVPAALAGVDPRLILDGGERMRRQCAVDVPAARNLGVALGAALAEAAIAGRDKLTFLADEPVSVLGGWLEQLIAESTGKSGRGIVPVDLEPAGKPQDYGQDRVFIYLCHDGRLSEFASDLRDAGHPVIECPMADLSAVGAEIYRWEFATAVASHVLGVNAFDQPDVEETKTRTQAILRQFAEKHALTEPAPVIHAEGIKVYSNIPLGASRVTGVMPALLAQCQSGDYVAVNAFLPRTTSIMNLLATLRAQIRRASGCATTLGFGPRFLHSTGQLHKGGVNSGVFLQLTAEPAVDLRIGKQDMTFGLMLRAQAIADYEALAARGRRVTWIHLPHANALENLVEQTR